MTSLPQCIQGKMVTIECSLYLVLLCFVANYTIYQSHWMKKVFRTQLQLLQIINDHSRVDNDVGIYNLYGSWLMSRGLLVTSEIPLCSIVDSVRKLPENKFQPSKDEQKANSRFCPRFFPLQIERKLGKNIKRETCLCLCICNATLFVLLYQLFTLPCSPWCPSWDHSLTNF